MREGLEIWVEAWGARSLLKNGFTTKGQNKILCPFDGSVEAHYMVHT